MLRNTAQDSSAKDRPAIAGKIECSRVNPREQRNEANGSREPPDSGVDLVESGFTPQEIRALHHLHEPNMQAMVDMAAELSAPDRYLALVIMKAIAAARVLRIGKAKLRPRTA